MDPTALVRTLAVKYSNLFFWFKRQLVGSGKNHFFELLKIFLVIHDVYSLAAELDYLWLIVRSFCRGLGLAFIVAIFAFGYGGPVLCVIFNAACCI